MGNEEWGFFRGVGGGCVEKRMIFEAGGRIAIRDVKGA